MSEDLSNAHLAILGLDELRDLAKKNEISITSNMNRAAMVRLLRQHGIGNAGQSHLHTTTVKLGYNDTRDRTPKKSLFAICHYIRSWDFQHNMHTKTWHN